MTDTTGQEGRRRLFEFLNGFTVPQLDYLAADPRRYVLENMDPALRRHTYVAAEDLIDRMTLRGVVQKRPGFTVYLKARPGEEHRWQLAALFADTVLLERPDWVPTLQFTNLIEVCRHSNRLGEFEPPTVSTPKGVLAMTNREAARDGEFDEIFEGVEWKLPSVTEIAEWRDSVLPDALASTIRFLIHLAAIGTYSRVMLVSSDMASARDTLRSLEELYWWEGEWRVAHNYVGGRPAPPGVNTFGEILRSLEVDWSAVKEVLGSYAVASPGLSHFPLIPSSSSARTAAVEFFTRFRRLHFGSPLISSAPQADLKEVPRDDADWRPAFYDEVAVAAFPSVATADASAFEYLHDLPELEKFREYIQGRCHIEPSNVREAQAQLDDIAYRLQQQANAAAGKLTRSIESGKRKIRRAGVTGAVGLGLGFATALPVTLPFLWQAGRALSSAMRDFDPVATLTEIDLVLLTLAEGRRLR